MLSLPQKMTAVMLTNYEGHLSLAELPLPALRSGEVLVKITAAPINPSDLIFLRGQYGIVKRLPVVPGFEGAGTVVASGGGLYGRWLVGKNVACRAPENGNGTWAEYMVTSADGCIPLMNDISLEQGAMLIVNPMTAWALVDIVRREGHKSFIQTAAASALGKMVARLAMRFKLSGIHVVRRPEQVQILKSLGCEQVLDSHAPGFEENLAKTARALGARIAFDAVGGTLTQQIAGAMPSGGRVVVYGALAGEACSFSPMDLIFKDKRLEGFWLTQWVKRKNILQKLLFARQVQKFLPGELQTRVQARFPLRQIQEAVELYKKQRTEGKVLLVPELP